MQIVLLIVIPLNLVPVISKNSQNDNRIFTPFTTVFNRSGNPADWNDRNR